LRPQIRFEERVPKIENACCELDTRTNCACVPNVPNLPRQQENQTHRLLALWIGRAAHCWHPVAFAVASFVLVAGRAARSRSPWIDRYSTRRKRLQQRAALLIQQQKR